MSKEQTLINVGTDENPVMVPKEVVEDDGESITFRQWWEGVATGSIVVPAEVLDMLLRTGTK